MYEQDTCAYCGAETWCDKNKANGKPMCRACRVVRFYERVLYPPLGFNLLWWQEKDLREIYGTLREDGRRQYRRFYETMAKKSGKSFWVAGMPIFHLCMEQDQEPGPLEAYGAASAQSQAGIVFRTAARMVRGNPMLRDKLRVLDATKRIVLRNGNGFYAAVSADGDVQDGVEPSLAIIDELHRWKTKKAQTLYAVLTKGQISRREPLVAEITTRGEEYESPLWESEDELAQRVVSGIVEYPRFYAAIYAADDQKHQADPEYWKSREARVAANPSHEDNGGFLKDEDLVDELRKAEESESAKTDYLRYNLNLKVNQSESRAINMDRWRLCDGGVDLREWPTYDVDLLIRKWNLLDKPCWAGVDLSATIDLTAVTLVFPPFDDCDQWTWLTFPFLAEKQVAEREKSDKVTYSDWVKKGFITTTEGFDIKTEPVKDKIRWAREMFDLREVCFDPYNARDTRNTLTDEGYTCVDISQTPVGLNGATKKLLGIYQDGLLRHGNNPVLNFAASCLSLRSDRVDNVAPSKPDRLRSSKRIDPIAAGVTGMVRAMTEEQSVYADAEVAI